MLDEINAIRELAIGQLGQVNGADGLERWRLTFLGKSGQVPGLLRRIGAQPAETRAQFGKEANEFRKELEVMLEARQAAVASARPAAAAPAFDVTLPGQSHRIGREHLINQTITELCEIFGRMGFDLATGPEVEDEFHNFVALNIPPAHPARDPLDNFYLQTPSPRGEGRGVGNVAQAAALPSAVSIDPGRLLRSQTSTIQIRVMEKQPPPVRVVAMGRTYRPDAIDARHHVMFHQIEGLYVAERVTMVDLKTCLNQFVHAYYGPAVRTRFRPSFFPFTEPSAEVDISWFDRAGAALPSSGSASPTKWVELGGCGMVDPAVFEAVGYDPERYTGFAFGLGIERILMRKYLLPDIRLLFEGDVRFLEQW